jgi:hypothetical protein
VTGRWFSPGILVSSTNKTDFHDKAEILKQGQIFDNEKIFFNIVPIYIRFYGNQKKSVFNVVPISPFIFFVFSEIQAI